MPCPIIQSPPRAMSVRFGLLAAHHARFTVFNRNRRPEGHCLSGRRFRRNVVQEVAQAAPLLQRDSGSPPVSVVRPPHQARPPGPLQVRIARPLDEALLRGPRPKERRLGLAPFPKYQRLGRGSARGGEVRLGTLALCAADAVLEVHAPIGLRVFLMSRGMALRSLMPAASVVCRVRKRCRPDVLLEHA